MPIRVHHEQLMTAATANSFLSRSAPLAAGLISTAAYVYLCVASQAYGQARLHQLLAVMAVCCAACFWLWHLQRRGRVQISVAWVVGFAVLFRVVGLFAYPVLEDDHYRYLWDGYMLAVQGSPYGLAPAAFFDVELPPRMAAALDGINYPDVPTIYGPAAQWVFAAGYLLAPGQVWPLQLICVMADLLVLGLLVRMAPLGWVLLYAWSPLVIKEYSFTAHIDVLGIAMLVAALYLARRRLLAVAGAALALAAGVKLFALLAAPFVLGRSVPGWLMLLLTALLISLPFGVLPAWMPEGLAVMADRWLFNAPLYLLWLALLSAQSLGLLKTALGLAFAALAAWQVWRYWYPSAGQPAQTPGGPLFWLFGVMFLVMPVVNPWYLGWWLVFAVFRPSYTAWVSSAAVLLSYVTGLNLGAQDMALYAQPAWALLLQFGAIAAALAADLRRPAGSA